MSSNTIYTMLYTYKVLHPHWQTPRIPVQDIDHYNMVKSIKYIDNIENYDILENTLRNTHNKYINYIIT